MQIKEKKYILVSFVGPFFNKEEAGFTSTFEPVHPLTLRYV